MSASFAPTLSSIPVFLEQLREDRFYGSLEIKLEAGRIVLLKKTETIKPTDPQASYALSRQSKETHGHIER